MKIKGLRWWIIVLIFIATVINYIVRTAFALLWPEMGEDLGMDGRWHLLFMPSHVELLPCLFLEDY